MAAPVDLNEFLEGFLAEADEHLDAASSHLLALEDAMQRGESLPRAVRELFRNLHTIKGLAAMVGVEPIVDVSHEMEGVLREADRAGGQLPAAALELLLQGTRVIEQRVRALASHRPVQDPPPHLLDALSALQSAGDWSGTTTAAELDLPAEIESKLSASERAELAQPLGPGCRAVRVDFVPSAERSANGLGIASVRERLAELGDLVRVLPRPAPETAGGVAFVLLLITSADDDAVASAAGTTANAVQLLRSGQPASLLEQPAATAWTALPDDDLHPQGSGYVRVQVERLDDALDKLSPLLVTRFKLSRAVSDLTARGIDVRELRPILDEHARQLRDLRAAIMSTRMVSVDEFLQRAPLLVRGLTRDTDKTVHLAIEADRAELDKAVAERVFPAIIHLLRNAVDHAVEPRAERRRLGKPEEGRIVIRADEASGAYLAIAVSDDGRGIDREAVARRAGMDAPATDQELLDLITRPGLSTRDEASRTSGRGMGMDIVKRTVEVLGGTLSLSTSPGAGTTFVVRVPVSVTIMDTFSFAVGDQVFVAPVSIVEEILEIEPTRVVNAPSGRGGSAGTQLIERRGEPIPLIALDALLRMPRQSELPRKALVVLRNGAPWAFAVQRVLAQQEVVVRPLEDPLVKSSGVAGAADLGDGRPSLVLDLVALAATAMTSPEAFV